MEKKDRKLSRIKSVVFYVCVAVILIFAFAALFANRSKGKPSFVFGYSLLWVKTESMEKTIPAQSYVLVKKADVSSLEKGDVITFVCNDPSSPVYGSLITHRIYEKTEEGFRTKGDNVLSVVDGWTVKEDEVVAVYVRNLPFLTALGRLFSSNFGFLLIIVLFLVLCAVFYLPDIFRILKESDEKDAEIDINEEEIQRRIREEVERLKRENASPRQLTEGREEENAERKE